MSDLHELAAVEQLAALRSREVSSVDLVMHYLDRIDRLDGPLAAFCTVTPELALDQATRADALIGSGEQHGLLGLPLAIKDMHPVAGVRTTLGSVALKDHVPGEDGWAVGRLRAAGAVVLGTTRTSELGAACFVDSSLGRGPVVTPYAPDRYASGSSAGAAAAVAAGLLPFAHGSDGAGSIRTPAAACHLVGVKPSRGLVSPGRWSPFLGLGTEGPLARTVADATLLLDAMVGAAPGDPYGWRLPSPLSSTTAPGLLRVAVWTGTGMSGGAPHDQALAAVDRTAALLTDLGHEVVAAAPPVEWDEPAVRAIQQLFAGSVGFGVASAVPADRRHLLTPYTRHLVDRGARSTAIELAEAYAVLAQRAGAYLAAFAGFDVALTPTTLGPPARIGSFTDGAPEAIAERMLAWSCFTPWANLSGQPAVALPTHLDSDGLPYGIQLVGRPRHDAQVLNLAAQLEHAGLWDRTTRPPCWDR